MRIKLATPLLGEFPRYADVKLTDNAAVTARNLRLNNGLISPLNGYVTGATLVLTGNPINSIHLWRVGNDSYWLRFTNVVNVVHSPIADDSYRRIYWTGDSRLDGAPKYSYTPAVYTGGAEYPINYYKLGIPAPTSAPIATLTSGGDNPNDEARVYVYTYVGKLGEESAPSPASTFLIVAHDGSTVTVSGLIVDSAASTGREIEYIRLYRSAVGSNGVADFYFVAQIAIASTTYADSKTTAQLAEALPSATWDEPRSDMQGLGLTGYGVAYGFSGKNICFSQPYLPYAWPRDYELTTDDPIVAIGAYDNYFIVGTTGRPSMITGVDPAYFSQQELSLIEACVSARSMVSMGHSAIYASPNGLVMASGGTAILITENIITQSEWLLLNPSSIHAYENRGMYLFFWKVDNNNKGGMLFDPRHPEEGFISLSRWFVAGHRDILTDTLWLVDENKVLYSFDDDPVNLLSATYKSKVFSLPKPAQFLAGRVLSQSNSDTTATLKVYADGVLRYTKTLTGNSAFRLPQSTGPARTWQVELTSKDPVREICIAENMRELQN